MKRINHVQAIIGSMNNGDVLLKMFASILVRKRTIQSLKLLHFADVYVNDALALARARAGGLHLHIALMEKDILIVLGKAL